MLSFMLAIVGFIALAKTMQRHRKNLCSVRKIFVFRVAGATILTFSFVHLCGAWGIADGVVGWLCLAALAAFLVVALLSGTSSFEKKNSPPDVENFF